MLFLCKVYLLVCFYFVPNVPVKQRMRKRISELNVWWVATGKAGYYVRGKTVKQAWIGASFILHQC
jgi:hypothetical protein